MKPTTLALWIISDLGLTRTTKRNVLLTPRRSVNFMLNFILSSVNPVAANMCSAFE